MLSSMVMLGLQRIVIRHGRLRATMGFHIDASDRAHAEQASTFDIAHQHSVSGFFYVAFSAKTSVAYVSSQKSDSDSAINVQADLTGEVDLTFETDYLPLNRLARAESIEKIRQNTPNPEANVPNHSAGVTARPDTGPSAGQIVSDRITAHGAEPAPTISPDPAQGRRRTPRPAAAPARRWARSPEAEDDDARGPCRGRPAARPVRGAGRRRDGDPGRGRGARRRPGQGAARVGAGLLPALPAWCGRR